MDLNIYRLIDYNSNPTAEIYEREEETQSESIDAEEAQKRYSPRLSRAGEAIRKCVG